MLIADSFNTEVYSMLRSYAIRNLAKLKGKIVFFLFNVQLRVRFQRLRAKADALVKRNIINVKEITFWDYQRTV